MARETTYNVKATEEEKNRIDKLVKVIQALETIKDPNAGTPPAVIVVIRALEHYLKKLEEELGIRAKL